MFHLVTLFATAALLSTQFQFVAAQIEATKLDLDNSLHPNVVEAIPRRRILRKFVRISDPPPATAKFDGRLELNCEAMGKPAPSIRWLKNDEPIVEYDMESNEIYTPDPTSLARVTSVLLVEDMADSAEDVYTCVAQSGMKAASASTTVYSSRGDESEDILALQKLLSRPKPRITAYYNDIFQEMGTTLLLPCEIHSYPKAQVFWSDTRNNLIFSNDRFKVLPSGALLITDMRWTDMGNFSCTAINKFGEETINTFVYPVKGGGDRLTKAGVNVTTSSETVGLTKRGAQNKRLIKKIVTAHRSGFKLHSYYLIQEQRADRSTNIRHVTYISK